MKQADSFLAMQAACPECGEVQEVDFADDRDSLDTWMCENPKCYKEFAYCHPENNYGLTDTVGEEVEI